MKPILSALLLTALLSAGCIPAPMGVHPWRKDAEMASAPTAPKTHSPAPPKPINPDEVNQQNLREKVSQLESEVRYDEGTAK